MQKLTTSNKRTEQINDTLRRVVLLRETGPKSSAWHRARVKTIWRLHAMLEQQHTTIPEPNTDTIVHAPFD